MTLEQLAFFFAGVLVDLEVALVTLALAVAHSLAVSDVKTVFPKTQLYTQTTRIQNNYGHMTLQSNLSLAVEI